MIIIAPEDDDTCDLKGAKNVITKMNNARGELVIVPGGEYSETDSLSKLIDRVLQVIMGSIPAAKITNNHSMFKLRS